MEMGRGGFSPPLYDSALMMVIMFITIASNYMIP